MTSILIPGPSTNNNSNLVIKSTSHLALPSGDSTQRDVTDFATIPGCIRYNETTTTLEYFKIDSWVGVLSGNEINPVNDYNKYLYLDNNGDITYRSLQSTDIDIFNNVSVNTGNFLIADGNQFQSLSISGEINIDNLGQSTVTTNFLSSKSDTSKNNNDYLLVLDSTNTYKKLSVGSLLTGLASSGEIPSTLDWTSITGKPSFATVATSGNYNDLTNKPTINSGIGFSQLSANNLTPSGLGSLSYDQQGNFSYTPANYSVVVNAPSGTGDLTYSNGVFTYTPPEITAPAQSQTQDLSFNEITTQKITSVDSILSLHSISNIILNALDGSVSIFSSNDTINLDNITIRSNAESPSSDDEGYNLEMRINDNGLYLKVNNEWHLLNMTKIFN